MYVYILSFGQLHFSCSNPPCDYLKLLRRSGYGRDIIIREFIEVARVFGREREF